MNTISDKIRNGKYLGQMEIMAEIKAAKREERPADFSSKTISDFSIIIEKIKFGLNLENAVILGPVFLGEIVVNGDLNLKNAKINGSLYLAKAEISGDLVLEDAKINGTINLVGAKIGKNIKARGLINTGFLSLTKTETGGDIILENAEVESVNYEDLTVRGDLFLDSAAVKGTLNLSKARVEGILDLDGTSIGNDLVLTGIQVKKNHVDTNTVKLGGRKII